MIRSFLSILSMMLFCVGQVNASDAQFGGADIIVEGVVVVGAPVPVLTNQAGPSTPTLPAEDIPIIMVTPPTSPPQLPENAGARDTPLKR